jgi:mannan endo-1,4-beta-mannosidase
MARSVLFNWANTTSAFIKSIDPNHMVALGDMGLGPLEGGDGSFPYTTAAGGYVWADILNNITTLDFATFELYPLICTALTPRASPLIPY